MGKISTIFVLFFSMLYCSMPCRAVAFNGSSTDESALLAIKAQITYDPDNILAKNWTKGISCCYWMGITCNYKHHRVMALNLSSKGLNGIIAKEIGNLSFLVSLDISNNNFHGYIPDQIGHLRRLRTLRMQLNELSGQIPESFGFLTRIQELVMYNNSLTGPFPPSIFNISSFQIINLMFNFLDGTLPVDICCNLPKLESLNVAYNQLKGPIPASLSQCSEIKLLALPFNEFTGSIPGNLGNLSKLEWLYLDKNKLTGELPSTLFNISSIRILSAPYNNISGSLPQDICKKTMKLEALYLYMNQLSGQIPSGLSQCQSLQDLSLANNSFTGRIPTGIWNMSSLLYLNLSSNALTGELPSTLFNMSSLRTLSAPYNNISGSIPQDICKESMKLELLHLFENQLSGQIPSGLSQCQSMIEISLSDNNLTGGIPTGIWNMSSLLYLHLNSNSLTVMNIAQLLKAGRTARTASSSGKTSPGDSTTVAAPAEEITPPLENIISIDEPKAASSGLPPLPEDKGKEKRKRNYKRKTPISTTEEAPPSKKIEIRPTSVTETTPSVETAEEIPTSVADDVPQNEEIPPSSPTEGNSQKILLTTTTLIPTPPLSSIPLNFSQDSAFGFLSKINPPQVPISYAPITHPGDFFCPSWGFNRNSRILTPALAQQWLNESILPRDQDSLKQLSNEELLNVFYLHSAQGAALSNRAAEIIHSSSNLRSLLDDEQTKMAELDKENRKLTDLQSKSATELEAGKKKMSELEQENKRLSDLHSGFETELEKEKKSTADLRSSLETEQKNSEVLRSQVGEVSSSLEIEKEKIKELQFTIQRLISSADNQQKRMDEVQRENNRLGDSILRFDRHVKAKKVQYDDLKGRYDHLKEVGSKQMIENFVKSKDFAELVSKINIPVIQIGYNEAVEAIQRDHLPDKSLKELGFEDDAEEKVNAAFKDITGAELDFPVRQFVPPTPIHENPEVNLPEPENPERNEQP